MEKTSLPYTAVPRPSKATKASRRPTIFLGIILILAGVANFGPSLNLFNRDPIELVKYDDIPELIYDQAWLDEHVKCPAQPEPLFPKMMWDMTEDEQTASIQKYSESVQIPTESFDDNGEPTKDPRWAPFFDFQKWLKRTFPTASEKATIEYINSLGILSTFEGSDPSLKPLVLMSHYDVVPAPASTFDRWTHPAFSGYNDGKSIWGRGSADDKTLVVAQWEAITHLLENGFEPRRTLIISNGFDEEEVFARRGQGHIAPFLEERYGRDGLLMVIDEGAGTDDDNYGAPFASPGMGEKGYLDIEIAVGTAGGHSSVPPEHTGIGIMSQIVTGLEDNPFPTKLTASAPFLQALMCAKEYSPSFPKSYAKLLDSEGPSSYPKLAKMMAAESRQRKAILGTTTAVDIVKGGVKVNALPEIVTANVNFRIDFSESVRSTQKHVEKILSKVAEKNGLQFSAWEGKDGDKDLGGRYVKVEMMGLPLEPAPRTPSSGGVWDMFAGTIKAVLPGPDGAERIVTPMANTGNTDCKMYYNLTRNIFRFMGGPSVNVSGAHTVDERSTIAGHFSIVRWVHSIIQNADAYDGEE